MRPILRGLVVPAVLAAIGLCPCAHAPEPQDSPHREPSIESVAAKKANLRNLMPVLHFDPLYLVQTAQLNTPR